MLQINNVKAYQLIQDLEALDIVKVLDKKIFTVDKLSTRFAGNLNLSEEEYHRLQESLSQSRNEWERNT